MNKQRQEREKIAHKILKEFFQQHNVFRVTFFTHNNFINQPFHPV